jgi:tetratricopeptide (TPR) repeat protein
MHAVIGPQTADWLYPVIKRLLALPGLIEAQKKTPDDVEANFTLASAWVALDHFRQAEPYLKRIVDLDPKNEKGHLDAARLLLAMAPAEDGDVELAIKNLDTFMATYKDSPETQSALMFKGQILAGDGRILEARKVFDDLRERFPTSEKAYEADKAIDEIDAVLKAGPPPSNPPAAGKDKPASQALPPDAPKKSESAG